MHLTRVVIIEDSKLLETRAHASARSYNCCACLKASCVSQYFFPWRHSDHFCAPEQKSLKPFEDSTLLLCKHNTTFSFVWAQKWPPHHVSELFKSVMEIAWRLWCPVLPAYSENSESFKQKLNAGLFRFSPVKWSPRDNKDAQDNFESKSMPLGLNFISLRSKPANSKYCL